MTKRVGPRVILATGLMSYATTALAGAWTLEEGTGQLIFTNTAMQATNLFSTGYALQPTPRYNKDEAQTLIDAEASSGDRRDKMVQSFNLGYRGFQQSYRTCTPAANLVIRRYVQEGAKIARDITARYAN